MVAPIRRVAVQKVGENKGKPRIWLEGKYLASLGFAADTRLSVSFQSGKIVIEACEGGDRKVSSRRSRPIIDLNTNDIVAAIGQCEKVEVTTEAGRIVITQAEIERRAEERQQNRTGTCGSVFSGGGLMDEAAKQAGFTSAFGVEWNADYADVWQANHNGTMFQGSIHEVFNKLPKVELLIGGIPCEPFSAKRRFAADGKACGAGDHELADMSTWAIFAAWVSNPRVIVFEEAPAYAESDIGKVTMAALRRLGYTVDHRVISGTDHGSLTVRKRTVIVAVQGAERINWPDEVQLNTTLGSILLPADDTRCEWFTRETKSWLFDHWDKQKAKGNGFASQVLTADTTRVPAVSKRYFSQQGDGVVVAHPTQPDTFRWLTLDEVKRLFGLPDDYQLPEAKTTAGEVLGQAVLVDVFARVIRSVTK